MFAIKATAFGIACAALVTNPSLAQVNQPDAASVRAGHNIAVTTCIACHVVSRDQTIKPVFGADIPSFLDIAKGPDATLASLSTDMKLARWHDPALAATLLPMSHLSDAERMQVAAYILSLRDGQ